MTEKERNYNSIHNTRKEFNLGCENYILFGFKECKKAVGTEPSVGSLHSISNSGTEGGRSLDDYILSLPTANLIEKYLA